MGRFTTTRLVDAAPERAFDAFTDLDNAAETVRAIKKLEVLGDGSIGVGTRFRETRMMFKREATEEMEITAFERPTRFAVECESRGCAIDSNFAFTPEGSGTRVDVEFDLKPLTFFAKMMTPVSKLMLLSCKKQFEADMEDMAAVAESKSDEVSLAT